jgi:predicted short-subunit dehydrogenase-like oxidoreductase (DUF2520 family)
VDDRPGLGIVGAGRAGVALALALTRRGWPVRALSSRDEGRRAAARGAVPGVPVVASAAEVARVSGITLLAVPDDRITTAVRDLGARSGTVVAHLSGVHPAAVLRDAVPAGVAVGAFHPLVAFADVTRAAEALDGAYVVLDGDPAAVTALRVVADALGSRAVVLTGSAVDAATGKAAHHAAAVLAAGGFVALLDAIVELGRVAGLDPATAVEVYGSLVRQGLANAAALGVDEALTGPVSRGDPGTVRSHLAAMPSPDTRALYVALARRQLAIARRTGRPDPDAAAVLEALLGAPEGPARIRSSHRRP